MPEEYDALGKGSAGDVDFVDDVVLYWQRLSPARGVEGHNMLTEADTCRKYVLPKLIDAGWDTAPHSFSEQKTFTDGRIVVAGKKPHRLKQKRADDLLRSTPDFRDPAFASCPARP